MTPLDESLRSTLASRTSDLDLPPDLLGGVERRARGMRRQRIAATVAGSALAVSALGLGAPVVASLISTSPVDRAPAATAPPAPSEAPFALDPADPWDYRGDPQVLEDGTPETTAREWGAAHAVEESDVRFAPLYGETTGTETVLVFLAEGPDGGPRWGVARSSESGPELLVDVPLMEGTRALPWATTTAAGDRLLVVAAPETALQYGPDGATEWRGMESVARGVGATDLDGDPATDAVRVLGPNGAVLVELDAPSPPVAAEEPVAPPVEDEGPGTETPVEVDPAPYAFAVGDPWAYRGPAELTQHPDLGSADERLFVAAGEGRDDGSWSQRPLFASEQPDGLSVLMVLHTNIQSRGPTPIAVVTTTWQRQDEAPQQAEQAVTDGQLLLQSFLPQSDGSGVLLALAAPRTGAVETDVAGAQQGANEQGWTLWRLPAGAPAGSVLLYSEGDGLLFHSEPARRS